MEQMEVQADENLMNGNEGKITGLFWWVWIQQCDEIRQRSSLTDLKDMLTVKCRISKFLEGQDTQLWFW